MEKVLQNDLLLRVAKGETVERPPVWLMRQAGRFLTEYKAVRAQAGSFREMIAQPDYAIEVTLQPVDLVGVDAAIIFSDILVIPEAMGLPYEMRPGEGPYFPATVRSEKDMGQLHPVADVSNLDHTYTAIKGVVESLNGRVPLIGFAGAPWTIFCYMVEGHGSKTFSQARRMLYQAPKLAHQLLQAITDATITYLKGQIAAGVDLVMVFDSWAGILNQALYRQVALPYIKQICDAIQRVPKTVFAKGAFFALPDLAELDCQVIGLDWHTPVDWATQWVSKQAFQGNLDPAQVYGTPTQVAAATVDMIKQFPAGRHIVNLGHGIYPDLPRESVMALVEAVKGFRYDAIS